MTARTLEYYEAKKRRLRLRDRAGLFFVGNELQWVGSLRGGAGSFPDVPSRRMAYDSDGTVVLGQNAAQSTIFEVAGGVVTAWNSEDTPGAQTGESDQGHYFIFPELREIDGVVTSRQKIGSDVDVQTSPDTTNGEDGTWTVRLTAIPQNVNIFRPEYRTTITSMAVSNIRGVWIDSNFGGSSTSNKRLEHAHLYGEISSGETPDRLLWIDNDNDLEFSLPVDYGDAPRGSAEDHVTYLKNNSASLAANSVQVTAEDLFLGSGSWYTFDDGTGFSSTKALASSISNGANSPNITIRRIIPDTETLGLHAARAFVSVGTWT